MSESLKPCPFCGGNAMFLTITNKSSHSAVGVMFKIKCMKCGTELPKSYECEMYMDQDGGIRKTSERKQLQIGTGGRTMGRLIDADAFERSVMCSDAEDMQDVIYALRDYPTAYDPDKVVEQLYGLKKYGNKYDSYWDSSLYQMTEFENKTINDAVEKAIEIVKGGGVDGN